MIGLIQEISTLPTEQDACLVLRAFIAVRRRYQPRYTSLDGGVTITPDQLEIAIREFVKQNSEGGKRAQAVVAGIIDAFARPQRVESGRINDPSRRHPGDVCVRRYGPSRVWEKAFEVRDKPVSDSDVQIFGKKCIDMGVREVALVMVAEGQPFLDETRLTDWANEFGIGLTLFYGWSQIIDQALFWSELPKPIAVRKAARFIHERLIGVEASPDSVEMWNKLVSR
jgi:hypothetical protein